MKKLLLMMATLMLSASLQAAEVGGVKLADSVHLGNRDLVLNGAGVRSKFIFDVYVAALYLDQKTTSDAAVLANANEKRVALHLLREVSGETFAEAFHKAMTSNHSAAELSALDAPLKQFSAIFTSMKEVNKGDVVTLDYLPGSGTQVSVNGVSKAMIAGAIFNTALLKMWLGNKPAQEDLKKKLLGM